MATFPKSLHIPYSEAEAMVKNYRAHSKKNSEFNAELHHVKAVWFPIEDIIAMCDTLKAENADGLRVYLGRYPHDVSGFKDPKPLPNTDTVIFVSTRPNDKGVPKSDYYTFGFMNPLNRGEQCEPTCDGDTIPV